MKIEDVRIPESAKKLLIETGFGELYPPQEEAVKTGALDGKNLVLASPTASGKTLVAEFSALKHVIEKGGKVLYLTPLRALASEKYEEFQKYARLEKKSGERIKIAISTGDYDNSDPWLERYDLIICSVDHNEPILVRKNGQLFSTSIGNFVDNLVDSSSDIIKQNGLEIVNVLHAGYETLAFNPESLKIEFRKIGKVIRHIISEPLYRLTLETGRQVSITSSHSIFVLNGLEIKAMKTSDVKVGDYVVIPSRLPLSGNYDGKINLITSFAPFSEARNLYVAGLPEALFNSITKKLTGCKNYERWNWKRRKHLPLEKILEFGLQNTVPEDCYFSYTASRHRVPITIHVQEELLRLLGYYIAEGSFDVKRYKVSFAFGASERNYVDDLSNCIQKVFNITPVISERSNVIYVEICNKAAFLFLHRVLGLKRGASRKEIPTVVYNVESSLQMGFLKAALRGDGSPSYIQTRYTTVNPKLASDFLYLFLNFGVVGSLFGKEYEVTLPSGRPFMSKTNQVLVSCREQLNRISEALSDSDSPPDLNRYCATSRVSMIPTSQLYNVLDPLTRQRSKKLYIHFGKRVPGQKLLKWINSHESISKINCLHVLSQEKTLTSKELSGTLSLEWSAVNEKLQKLLKRNLIRREGKAGHYRYSITETGLKVLEDVDTVRQLVESDLAFAKVKKIEVVAPTTKYVYDLSVPDCENFITGYGGVICHNTNEKADSLLRHRAPWMSEVSLAVADEVHLLNDMDRGPTLEVVLARLLQINPNAQFLALSATIRNAEEIAEWLKARSITTEWRPVKLKEGVYLHGEVVFKDGSSYKVEEAYKNPAINMVVRILKQGGQALIFAETRKASVELANKASLVVKNFLSRPEERSLKEASSKILETGERTRISKLLAELITRGTAFHHAGLYGPHRKIIEDSFRTGKIKVVVATPTLAAGVNLPARLVVVNSYERFEPGYGRYPIPVLEYKQMAGRAGRPKYDKIGEAILIARTPDEQEYLMESYICAEPERIWSRLAVERVLRSHVLATIASGFAHTERGLYDFLDKTFYAFQYDPKHIRGVVGRALKFLVQEEMVRFDRENIIATEFGRRVSELYIDPESAVILRDGLYNRAEILTDISFLHLICHTPDMAPKFYPRRKELKELEMYLDEHREELMFPVPDEWTDRIAFEEYVAELKGARVLECWINEMSEDDIIERYAVEPGDLFRFVENANWLLYASHELAQLFRHKDMLQTINTLRERVIDGIKSELLPLVRLEGIGRVRARLLYNAGFRTIDDLKKASISQLTRVPLIGLQMAKKIKDQVGGLIKLEDLKKLKTDRGEEQTSLTDYK